MTYLKQISEFKYLTIIYFWALVNLKNALVAFKHLLHSKPSAQPLFHFVIVDIIFLINVDVVLRYNTYKKLAKNQTTSKQYPDAEHLLFEIY